MKLKSLFLVQWILLGLSSVWGQTSSVNYVRSTIYPNGAENISVPGLLGIEQPNQLPVQSIGYFNGWAQDIQSLSQSDRSGYVVLSRKYYDFRGRPMVIGKPFEIASLDSLNYKPLTMVGYLSTFPAAGDSAFERIVYQNQVEDRISFRMPFGSVYHNTTRALKYDHYYDSVYQAIQSRITDEDGMMQDTYVDRAGRAIRKVTKMNTYNDDLITLFDYDVLGNVTRSYSPLGVKYKDTIGNHQDIIMPYGVYEDGTKAVKGGPELSKNTDNWSNEAPINNPNHPVLRYEKPAGALNATVTLSYYKSTGDCPYSIELQYRISPASGVGQWVNIGSQTPVSLVLKQEDMKVEFRRRRLMNTGTGCTQSEIHIRLDAIASVVDSAKYVTAYKYDNQNRLIEKRSPDEGTSFYVYDLMGRLRFVQDENHRTNFMFNGQRSYWTYYKYDALGRMIEQGELTQDHSIDSLRIKAAVARILRNVTYTTWSDTLTMDSIDCFAEQKALNSREAGLPPGGGGGGEICDTITVTHIHNYTDSVVTYTVLDTLYGDASFPKSSDAIIKTVVNQYDTYSTGWQIAIPTTDTSAGNPIVSSPKTRLTRTKIFDANANNWTEEAYVYDRYGRVNYRHVYIPELAQTKKFQYYYDASGRVLKTMYQDGVASESFYQWFKYDNLSRLDSVFSSRTNNRSTAVREAAYDYDNNHGGKILTTKLGNNIQQVDYTYNSRDWLKYINNVNNLGTDKFALSLGYDTVGTNSRYNGNISASASLVSGQSQYAYNYVYDNANRLTDANYSGNLFSERMIDYDANGNIRELTRHRNSSTASPITYYYDASKPNQLKYVTEALSDSFYYDANGNMTRDKLKGNFDYDYRNMPVKMYLNGGRVLHIAYDAGGQRIKFLRKNGSTTLDSSKIFILGANGKVVAEYLYRAATTTWSVEHYNIYGNELIGKVVPAATASGPGLINLQGTIQGTYLADSAAVINASTANGTSLTISTTKGMVFKAGFTSNGATIMAKPNQDARYYYLSDHLGSVRVTLKEDGSIDSWSDYYPFGKEARGSNTVNEPKEQFTGKERDYESGLDYFGARYYNSEVGRWVSVDPIHQYASGYVYVGNNPIVLVDPKGLEAAHSADGIKEFDDRVASYEGGNGGSSTRQKETSKDSDGENGSGGNLAAMFGQIKNQVFSKFKKSSKNPAFNVSPAAGIINHGFGSKKLHKNGHAGTDIINVEGTPIIATASGQVTFIDNWTNRNTLDTEPVNDNSMGMMVRLDHGDNETTEYGHLYKVLVEKDAFVQRGDVIGLMGNTGASTNPHLHFMYKVNGTPRDPNEFVPALKQMEIGNVHSP